MPVRRLRFLSVALGPLASTSALLMATACSESATDPCALEDQDGIIGGRRALEIRVEEDGFEPSVVKTQNQATVTLMLENNGSDDAGFVIECLPTRNEDGCAQESCFPEEATIDPIPPGESETIEFEAPMVEGVYIFRTAPGDDRTGQFVLD